MKGRVVRERARRESEHGAREVERPIQKILVIHQGALGDFLCFLPALASLRRSIPHAHVTLMGYPRILELAEGRYYGDAVVSVEGAEVALLYQERKRPPRAFEDFLRTFQLICVVGSGKGPFVRNLQAISGARVVAVPPFPPRGEKVHMVDHLLSLPRCMGLPVPGDVPELRLSDKDRVEAQRLLGSLGIDSESRLIAIHPGSGSPAKVWPIERFRTLAQALRPAYKAMILFIMGPGEEQVREELLECRRPEGSVVVEGLSLPELGALLEKCSIFIGNDSGVTHLAAAVGVPVVAIFGPSDPARWAPRGRKIVLVSKDISCAPCDRQAMARCKVRRCLLDIPVDQVFQAVGRIMGKDSRGRSRFLNLPADFPDRAGGDVVPCVRMRAGGIEKGGLPWQRKRWEQ